MSVSRRTAGRPLTGSVGSVRTPPLKATLCQGCSKQHLGCWYNTWARYKGSLWAGAGKRGSNWGHRKQKKASPGSQGITRRSITEEIRESWESMMSKEWYDNVVITAHNKVQMYHVQSNCLMILFFTHIITHLNSQSSASHIICGEGQFTLTDVFCKIQSSEWLENWSSTYMSWQWQFAIQASRCWFCFCTYYRPKTAHRLMSLNKLLSFLRHSAFFNTSVQLTIDSAF